MRKKVLLSVIFIVCALFVFSQETSKDDRVLTKIQELDAKIKDAIEKLNKNELNVNCLDSISKDLLKLNSYLILYIADSLASEVTKETSNLKKRIDDLTTQLDTMKKDNDTLSKRLKYLKDENFLALIKQADEIRKDSEMETLKIGKIEGEKKEIETKLLDINSKIEKVNKENGQLSASLENSKNKIIELQTKIDKYKNAVKFGLSIGINAFLNNQLTYTVQADQTVREKGDSAGFCGMVSAVVAIKVGKKNSLNYIAINIPLGDFTSDSSKAIGIFNNRMAVGLGYCRQFSHETPLCFAIMVNLSPYDSIDYDEIKGRKFDLPEFTILKPEDYGSIQAWSPSLTIGVVYLF